MDNRLYLASVKGDVDTLNSLIHENPWIPEIGTVGRLNQNPLHIAASVGQLAFARKLLSLNPNLATRSDSRRRLPLHWASEKGNVEIVRELLLHANDAVCLQVDLEGRIPLHLAAMQGHVDVIMELIGARPESIMVTKKEESSEEKQKNKEMESIGPRPESINIVTNKEELIGETVLHLCVRYNRLEALKLLLDLAPSDSLVRAQDDDGNTVLHLAAALKNREIIKYLLSLPDVKELLAPMMNKKNFTALDVLEQSTITDDKSIEIQDILLQAGVSRAQKIERSLTKYLEKFWNMVEYFRMDESWLKESRGHLLTTSTVIATVAFQAGVTPPGGVWQDDGNGTTQGSHEAGTSIIATKNSSLLAKFVLCNTTSFATSLLVILLLITGVDIKNNVLMVILNVAMFYSILFMVSAYSVSAKMMIPGTDSKRTAVAYICDSAVIICIAMLPIVMLRSFYLSKRVKSKLNGKDQSKPDGSSASDHSEA